MTEEDRKLLELAQDNEAYFLMSRRDRKRVRELEREIENGVHMPRMREDI